MADSLLNNDQANAGAETIEQASVALMGPLSDLMEITTTTSEGYLQSAKGKNISIMPIVFLAHLNFCRLLLLPSQIKREESFLTF